MVAPKKEFHQYLIADHKDVYANHEDYLKSPAIALLKYVVEAKNTINLCERSFKDTKISLDGLKRITVAFLPAIMGHFETYQRYLFAGTFDRSIHIQNFNLEKFFKNLNSQYSLSIDPFRLSAYRGLGTSSIGNLLADSLIGWHDPKKVNKYFECFDMKKQFFSNDAVDQLRVLWQLRHSIVHTGGTLTPSDAQKLNTLADKGGKQIVFADNFIFEVARKLHPIVKDATVNIGNAFKSKQKNNLDQSIKDDIETFFAVRSSVGVWLK